MVFSSVQFLNIKNIEIDLDSMRNILVEYVVNEKVNVSSSDWIALFPTGCDFWNSLKLDLLAAYEFVLSVPISKAERRYSLQFSLKGAKNLKYGFKYQFVYISRHSDIYGISKPFEFRPPVMIKIPEESDVSEDIDDKNKENCDNNSLKTKVINIKGNRRTSQTSQSFEIRNNKSSYENENANLTVEDMAGKKKFIDKFNKNKQVFVKKLSECQSNRAHQPPPPVSCSNCHRVEGLLQAQDKLYGTIKQMAETNSELRSQVGLAQGQLELSQAACQKLSLTLMREKQARMFYQHVAYMAELEYQVMVVEPQSTSSSDQRPGRFRDKEKTKAGYSLLRLKAIIGDQEETIQRLMKEIEELKMEKTTKVKVVEKVIEDEVNLEVPQVMTSAEIKTAKEEPSEPTEGET